MLDLTSMVPEVYIGSRDYQAILRLVGVLINNIQSDNANIVDIINPDRCPDHLLPLLASYVGYKYDYKETYDANRIIIKNYPSMIRNRGNEVGIDLAAALSVSISEKFESVEDLSMFHMYYDSETGEINIFYPSYLSKLRDLIEIVRPAGVRCKLTPATSIKSDDQIRLSEFTEVVKHKYNEEQDSSVYIVLKTLDDSSMENRGIEYKIEFGADGKISSNSIDENGYLIPTAPNTRKIYRLVGIRSVHESSGEYVINTISSFDDLVSGDIIYQISLKNILTGRIFDIRTDRFKISDKGRIGFSEIYHDLEDTDTVYIGNP